MANWTKKISKAAGDDLEPGERVISGVFLQRSGTMGQSVAMGVGGLVGKAVASKLGGGTATALVTDAGIAATMPDTATVLGLTGRRVLVYGHAALSGKPKDLKLSIPVSDVDWVEVDKQRATFRFVLHFRDGSASVYEAPRVSNDPEAFAEALAAL
jgi:hypothetical protein